MPGRRRHAPAPQGPGLRAPRGVVDQRAPRSSPTWTSTSRPRCPPCSRWWRRCCRVTATSPSARGWPPARTSCAAPSASSSRGPTTCCSSSRCAAASATPSAASRRCAATRPSKLLPLVEDNEWFFDTELLVTAERLGLRIGEVPVDWVDDPDSRVHIVSTAADDLRGVWRMLVRRPKGLRRVRSNEVAADQLLRFAGRRRGLHARLPLPLRRLAPAPRRLRRQRRRHGDRHPVQHRRAPRALPRHATGRPGAAALLAVAGGLYLVSLGLHDAAAWSWPSGSPRRALLARARGPHRGQRWSPPSSASPCCGPGSSARAPAPAPARLEVSR